MLKAYKYRIYPTPSQEVLIAKHIGASRLVYNLALEVKQTAFKAIKKNYTAFDIMKQIQGLRQDYPWLKETSIYSLQQSVLNMDKAYKMFFKGKNNYPRYKSKHRSKQSYQMSAGTKVNFETGKIQIPKFKEGIKAVLHREFEGIAKTTTVSKTPTGKYFVSILVDDKQELPVSKPIEENTSIGIDLGLKSFLVTSEGEVYDNPKYLKSSISRLKVLQNRASKKKKGSSNRKKANLKVAILHEKITNQRKDFLHKTSSKIIGENQTICIEDLNIAGMVKNHNLAQSISDVGWGMFVEMLKYKSSWYGKNLLQIGRFEPSSKTCNDCGHVKKDMTLIDREWTCICGSIHDRDTNAAINIKNFALKNSGKQLANEPVESPTLVGTMKQEARNSGWPPNTMDNFFKN